MEPIANLEKYIRLEEGLGRVRGNRKLFATLLQSFLKSTYLEQICTEIEQADMAKAAVTAHTIKGMTANLSLVGLSEASAHLEAQIKGGLIAEDGVEQFREMYQSTINCVQNIVVQLQESGDGGQS